MSLNRIKFDILNIQGDASIQNTKLNGVLNTNSNNVSNAEAVFVDTFNTSGNLCVHDTLYTKDTLVVANIDNSGSLITIDGDLLVTGDLVASNISGGSGGGTNIFTIERITSSTTWSVPATANVANFVIIGGGGGGGAGISFIGPYYGRAGGGGGSGDYIYANNIDLSSTTSITVTIGAGGGGAPAPTAMSPSVLDGGDGGSTVVTLNPGGRIFTATGGDGGGRSNTGAAPIRHGGDGGYGGGGGDGDSKDSSFSPGTYGKAGIGWYESGEKHFHYTVSIPPRGGDGGGNVGSGGIGQWTGGGGGSGDNAGGGGGGGPGGGKGSNSSMVASPGLPGSGGGGGGASGGDGYSFPDARHAGANGGTGSVTIMWS